LLLLLRARRTYFAARPSFTWMSLLLSSAIVVVPFLSFLRGASSETRHIPFTNNGWGRATGWRSGRAFHGVARIRTCRE
jgi:hypothetical protein